MAAAVTGAAGQVSLRGSWVGSASPFPEMPPRFASKPPDTFIHITYWSQPVQWLLRVGADWAACDKRPLPWSSLAICLSRIGSVLCTCDEALYRFVRLNPTARLHLAFFQENPQA